MPRQITRIDLEKSPGGVRIAAWREGWQEGDPAHEHDFAAGQTLDRLLMQYEQQGFTCHTDGQVGRCLRGPITRIDFRQTPHGWHVAKYPYGWTASTRPLYQEDKPAGFDLEAALAWCQANGWSVRRWPGGARAWKGQPLPIRSAVDIIRLRRRLETQYTNYGDSGGLRIYDLAFDL